MSADPSLRIGGAAPAGLVRRASALEDQGVVTMELAGGRGARVHLSRAGDGWTPQRLEMIPASELGRGFSIQRGGTTIHANL